MSGPHSLCPECMARVLPDWSVCKFCGHTLIGVVPAPWEEPVAPEPSGSRPGGGGGAGMSFFDMYGDFDTTTPLDEYDALPPGDEGPLALPPAPDDTVAPPVGSFETTPYPDQAPVAPSLFGGRSSHDAPGPGGPPPPPPPPPAPVWEDGGPAEESWWTQPPVGAERPGPGSEGTAAHAAGAPAGPDLAPPPPPYGDATFEPSAWGQEHQPGGLAPLEAPVTPLPPAAKPPRLSREFRIGALGIVVLLALMTIGYRLQEGPGHDWPAQWDPQVAPLADFVAKDRGLAFKHAVPVHFLSAREYHDASVGGGEQLSEKDRQEIADYTAMFRALGLLKGTPDLAKATSTLSDSGTLAFYSFEKKAIYIRGSKLTVGMKVTLVHELTHVLQDQWFDLGRMSSMGEDAEQFRGVVEGDASLVESDYVDKLPEADRKAYEKESDAQSTDADDELRHVPTILTTFFGAPYAFGDGFAHVLRSSRGNQALDEALRVPPAADAQLFDPYRYLEGTRPLHVDAIDVPKGAKKLQDGEFGATALYLTLADRIDPIEALGAADAWAGDQMLAYKRPDQKVCVSARFRGATDSDGSALEHALDRWSATLPAGQAVVGRDGSAVTLEACDPGDRSALEVGDRSDETILLPVTRTQVAVALYDQVKDIPNGVNGPILSPGQTRCIADHVVHGMPLDQILQPDEHPVDEETVQSLMVEGRLLCKPGSTTSSGTS